MIKKSTKRRKKSVFEDNATEQVELLEKLK